MSQCKTNGRDTMNYEIGDRLKIGGHFCTVKFIGVIKPWPSIKAYGVEWDDHSRGKNSGTIDDIHYFDVHIPNSGSFLKESKIKSSNVHRITFYEALSEKYGSSSNSINSLSIGNKRIESLGFDELDARNKNFKKLRKIALRDSDIAILFRSQDELNYVVRECVSIRDLDLSLNLLTDINSLCEFIEPLKSLESLNLSQNKLSKGWDNLKKYDLSHIKTLRLSSCDLSYEHVDKLLKSFSALKMLDLSYNNLTGVGIQNFKTEIPRTLEELNISGNNLVSFPLFPTDLTLKGLNISDNQISRTPSIAIYSIESLDITDNKFKERKVIDDLNMAFPSLRNIHLSGNELKYNGNDVNVEEQATFYEVLARFDHVMVLNGSICNIKTRREAEMFFISKVVNNELDYDTNLPRWSRLIKSHEIDTNKLNLNKSRVTRQSLVLKIKVRAGKEPNGDLNYWVLPSFTVRYVKSIICRKLELDVLKVRLFHENSKGMINEINHNFRPISDFNIVDGDIIHVYFTSK
ncbi:Pac2p [Saccharomyces paradoxus]|uniref:Pac2p n=1 Tax=Saccharomyces paradoxus TaxID=27291 RepID=A0A8B8UPX8_SACPA|nr:Pac2 [Saccharomyces paradoxus]QHS72787.1 Pac2 [Saccharomyces paradoxus]